MPNGLTCLESHEGCKDSTIDSFNMVYDACNTQNSIGLLGMTICTIKKHTYVIYCIYILNFGIFDILQAISIYEKIKSKELNKESSSRYMHMYT